MPFQWLCWVLGDLFESENLSSFVTGGSGTLAIYKGKEFPETCMGGCASVVWFIDDGQLRFPS